MTLRNKWGQRLCEHGRVQTRCPLCGGGSICIHERRRDACKECGNHGAFKKGGFSKEEIQQIGAVKKCQFPGCPVWSDALHSDHDHTCCPYLKLCPECYRGEICRGHNIWMAAFDAHPEWATADIREYLSRRPYARNPRFLLMSKSKGENHDSQL